MPQQRPDKQSSEGIFERLSVSNINQIVNRRDQTLTPGMAAFELLLDIVGLFRWILDLLDHFR